MVFVVLILFLEFLVDGFFFFLVFCLELDLLFIGLLNVLNGMINIGLGLCLLFLFEFFLLVLFVLCFVLVFLRIGSLIKGLVLLVMLIVVEFL